MKKKKEFSVSVDMFNDKRLIACMDLLSFLSPAKAKNEKEIRERDRKAIKDGKLGMPVPRTPSNHNGVLDRDRILVGTTLFGDRPNVTEEDIRLISEGGFDFLISQNGGAYGRRVLDWCEKYGLAVIGNDCACCSENDTAFVPHPASVGDCGWDEPSVKAYAELNNLHKRYHEHYPERFLFSNLFPAGAVSSQLGTRSYTDYVDSFSREVDTDYISADIYPFHPVKIINRYEMAICLLTYHCVGNACRRDGKDFWLYIQSQCRWFSHLYTMTTYEMIKWQVYASLCYGCRSIIHASYNPVWGDDAIGMIDYDGNLTEQYLYAKRVNAEIRKLSPVLKNYRSLGVGIAKAKRINPHFLIANPVQEYQNKKQRFTGIPVIQSIESESSALAGYFSDCDGHYALMLVNCKNIYNPDASQEITVRFSREVSVRVYEHGESVTRIKCTEISVYPGSCDGIFITIN